MAETQVVKSNGSTPVAPAVTLESLQAQLAAVLAENAALKARPSIATGAVYGIIPASGKYGTSAKMSLPSGGQIIGPRKKFVELIEEVNSGRITAFLDAHPEVK